MSSMDSDSFTDDSEEYLILSKGKLADDDQTFLGLNNEDADSFWNHFWFSDDEIDDNAEAKSLFNQKLDMLNMSNMKSHFVPESSVDYEQSQCLDVNLDVLINVSDVIKNLTEENRVLKIGIEYFKATTLKNYSLIKDNYVEKCNCCGQGHELADSVSYLGCAVCELIYCDPYCYHFHLHLCESQMSSEKLYFMQTAFKNFCGKILYV